MCINLLPVNELKNKIIADRKLYLNEYKRDIKHIKFRGASGGLNKATTAMLAQVTKKETKSS